MITLLLHVLRLPPFLWGGHRLLALGTSPRANNSPSTNERAPGRHYAETDHLFWVGLATVWAGWRQSFVIVTPNTVPRLRGSGVRADELVQSVPGRRRRDVLEEDRGVVR
jgi:hypothetical protein